MLRFSKQRHFTLTQIHRNLQRSYAGLEEVGFKQREYNIYLDGVNINKYGLEELRFASEICFRPPLPVLLTRMNISNNAFNVRFYCSKLVYKGENNRYLLHKPLSSCRSHWCSLILSTKYHCFLNTPSAELFPFSRLRTVSYIRKSLSDILTALHSSALWMYLVWDSFSVCI